MNPFNRLKKLKKKRKRTREESQQIRMMILVGVGILIFLALVTRLFIVMVIRGPEYAAMASRQQIRTNSIHAQRGRIMDTNGTVLAQTGTTYRVLVNPQVIPTGEEGEMQRVSAAIRLSEILGMSYDTVYEKIARVDKSQLVLKRQVSRETVAQINALQLDRVVTFDTDYTRYYTNGKLFAQLIGFSGADGEGQTGLEAYLDESLSGKNGRVVFQKDARGNALAYGDEQYIPPLNGYDVNLTVDANIQQYMEDSLAQYAVATGALNATGLVLEPSTGRIIATGSYPTFDLNNPDRSDVKSLMAMSRNRCVTDTFECGTMFKLITLAAALDTGVATLDSTYNCTGSMTFRTETFYCRTYQRTHRTQTLAQAIANDCDCVFMQLALQLGPDRLYDYISAFGFGTSTKSGMPNETSGKVPHRKYSRQDNLALMGTGRGATTTLMQMAQALSAMINGGILYRPYVVSTIVDENGEITKQTEPTMLRRVISSSTSEQMRRLLQANVASGDGAGATMAGFTSGGKGGSSQTFDEDGNASRTVYVASYMGFAPAEDPKFICLFSSNEPAVPAQYTRYVTAPFVGTTLENLLRYVGQLPNASNETIVMPDVRNQTAKNAAYILVRSGMTSPVYLESEEEAYVVRQIPAAGVTVPKNIRPILFTSMTTFNDDGVRSSQVKVPNLLDRRRQDAYDVLEKVGLTLNYDKTACLGKITGQSIEAGTYVDPGTEVYVTFSDAVPSAVPAPSPPEEPEEE